MLQHMVWMKFHEGVSAARVQAHLEALAGLAGEIDCIEGLWVGPNMTDRARGFTHGLLVSLPDRAALPRYLDHPAHQAVGQALKAEAEVIVMDIEAGDAAGGTAGGVAGAR